MKRVAKWTVVGIITVCVLAVALVLQTIYFKPFRIDWFYTRVFATYALDNPELLSGLRLLPSWLDVYGGKLGDASPEHDLGMAREMRDDLAMLDRFDISADDREGRLSYDTLHYFLKIRVDGQPYLFHDFPVNQYAGVQSALPEFMEQMHMVRNTAEAEHYIERLNRFPLKFSQLISSLKRREAIGVIPPRFTVEKVLLQMRTFIAKPPQQHELYVSFKGKLDRIPERNMSGATRAALLAATAAAIRDSVYPAYRDLIAYFDTLKPKALTNRGAWSLPSGDAYYAWCVRMHTTTDLSPQQVHDLGLAEVARVGAQMDSILRQQGLSEGTIGARLLTLAHRPDQTYPDTPAGRRAILVRYQAILDDIDQGLGSSFDLRPRLGVKVEQVPTLSEATAPTAYYKMGAFDGSRPGVFYVNLRNPADVTKFTMPTTAYHEGIPGHHFQLSIAQGMSGVPFFRRILPFTAYNEGWALYAERLAYELGFEKDPLDNLGRLSGEMMRAARLVVDTGIHYKRWTRERAIAYMVDNVGMTEQDATAEVERYFVDPGQALAYQVGMLKILELRERARRELGAEFSLKRFHDEVLGHGALPLAVLERTIDEWIKRGKRAAP